MAETTEKLPPAAGGSGDLLLLIVAGAALVGALAAYYVPVSWPIYARWGALVAGLAASVGAFSVSRYGHALWEFIGVSRVELRKMVWPTWDETKRTTAVVIAFVVILGVFFWVIDWILGWASRQLLGGGV